MSYFLIAKKNFKEAENILNESNDFSLSKIIVGTGKDSYYEVSKFALAPSGDPERDSPNIVIAPQENLIQKAVDLLKSKDPNFFVGIKKIVSGEEPNYGHVESGPGKDHTIIHINYPRISREIKAKMQGASQEEIDTQIAKSVAATIAHERGHVMSYDLEEGFKGGESPAEAAEQEWINKLK